MPVNSTSSNAEATSESPEGTGVPAARLRRITILHRGYECAISLGTVRTVVAGGGLTPFDIETKAPPGSDPESTLKANAEVAATADDSTVVLMEMKGAGGGTDPGPTVTLRLEI